MITEVIDHSGLRSTVESFSMGTFVAVLLGVLPTVIAIVPALYWGIMIWESKTVQNWRRRRRRLKAHRRRLHQRQHHQR